MDYDLSRIDYTISGITFPDTLKVLSCPEQKIQHKMVRIYQRKTDGPSWSKETLCQALSGYEAAKLNCFIFLFFAVGDKNGVLQCLSIKDEEPVVQFKTLPGKPITSLQIASSSGDRAYKIFAASGNEVKGYTRRGKVFLSIETSASETITSMCVLGSDLILCSGRTVTFYRDLKEIYSYVCEDRVLDIAAFGTPNTNRVRLLVLIANKGAMILENGQQQRRTYVSSGPTRISTPPALHMSEVCAFYGAADGSIGLIFYEEAQLKSTCLVEGRGLGSVMCIGWFISNVGTHLAVGRHDGSIQLYLVNNDNFQEKPRLKYTYFCGEPVTSVSGGCISSEEPEVLASTFSGRIFALRSRRFAPTSGMGNISQEALALRRSKLETEVARLEKQTVNEREKYERNTRSFSAGVSAPPLLDLQYELSGATQDSWQELKLISAAPLDVLFIYCINKLDIQTDSAAVLSVCPPQNKDEDLLATIRCQAGTRRLWLRIRIQISNNATLMEGSKVFIYVLPAGVPRVARLIQLYLPILPHYFKHELTEEENKRGPWCELRVTGSFSVAEMTSWLTELLPRELPRPTSSVAFARSHSLLDTILICKFQRGEAVFKSDDVSAICVIKEVLSNNSVKKGKQVEISCDNPKICCFNAFQRIKEKFIAEYKKKIEFELKKALMSLDLVKDENEPVLCNDYLKILNSSEDNSENCFNDYVDIVLKWYEDWFKVKGNHVKKTTTNLREAVTKCNIDEIEIILSMET